MTDNKVSPPHTEFESGLEAAPQNFPELAAGDYHPESRYPQAYQNQQVYQNQPSYPQPYQSFPHVATPKPEYNGDGGSPFAPEGGAAMGKKPRTVLGCSMVVFILSSVITLLSAALIGLAAATGVEVARANDNANKAAVLSTALAAATPTTTIVSSPSATSFNQLSNSCTDDPEGMTRQNYTTFSLLGQVKFTRYCDKDTPNAPLLSLFTADFERCMDACSGYSKYIPEHFNQKANSTCAGVSFVPLWTDKTTAEAGGAPGNCYLKPGPIEESDLKTPNIGTECHAAILA